MSTIHWMNDPGFEILYEQGPCLVVCKPPGLSTQSPPGIDSLEVRIKAFLKQRDERPGYVYLGVPHRLDRPASGAIVFGKHSRATRRLARQFEHREVKKLYWAIVEGQVAPAEGTWEDYLWKVHGEARAEVVAADHREGRLARLNYRTLASVPRRHVAGNRTADRPHAPGPHPGGLARTSRLGRRPVRLGRPLRTAARRRAPASHCLARAEHRVPASDDERSCFRDGASSRVLASSERRIEK